MSNEQTQDLNQELFNKLLSEVKDFSTASILENLLNMIMKGERSIHLKNNIADKGNGFYQRTLGTPVGKLNLEVPRDRDGDFRPQVLPDRYSRDTQDRLNTLKALLTASYSPSAINEAFNSLGLSYSTKELSDLKELYLAEFNSWSARELPSDVIGLFIDGYVSDLNHEGKVKKMTTFSVLGFDFNGFKDLYSIEFNIGCETKEYWLQVFNRLIDRGLKHPLFVVSDDFPGITDAINTLFPKSLHQLCFVHLQRNVRKNMAKHDSKDFNARLSNLKNSSNFESGISDFSKLLSAYENKYPSFIKYLNLKKEKYFSFLHLEQDIRKYFYTTNSVESFNSILEKKRNKQGGFFQSVESFKINIFIHYKKLKTQKWCKPQPLIKGNLYSLNQKFAQVFDRSPLIKTQNT
jgi:transposase-like protein